MHMFIYIFWNTCLFHSFMHTYKHPSIFWTFISSITLLTQCFAGSSFGIFAPEVERSFEIRSRSEFQLAKQRPRQCPLDSYCNTPLFNYSLTLQPGQGGLDGIIKR
jgi:hypothetical protein